VTTLAESLTALTEKQGLRVERLSLRTSAIDNPKTGFHRKLKRPITLRAVKCPDYWVVSARAPLAHGTAPQLEDAVADFIQDWEERLDWLEQGGRKDSLGPGPAQELAVLRRLMA
jgi:hypothetical protein